MCSLVYFLPENFGDGVFSPAQRRPQAKGGVETGGVGVWVCAWSVRPSAVRRGASAPAVLCAESPLSSCALLCLSLSAPVHAYDLRVDSRLIRPAHGLLWCVRYVYPLTPTE